MIPGRQAGGRAGSMLLPAEGLHWPTAALMGVMTFAMMVIAAAGLALAGAAGTLASGVASRYVIEIPAGTETDLDAALAAARSIKGVRGADAVPEAEMRRTLRRWLGEMAASPDLPVPELVTLDLSPQANPEKVGAAVRERIPGARFIAEAQELEPLLDSLRSLQWLALSLVALIAAANAAAIVLAARGALDTHRSTVEIMHGIGATDMQIVRLFERKIAGDSLAGALAGALAALLAVLFVGGGLSAIAGGLAALPALEPGSMLALALIPAAAVALSVLVARLTLLKALRATL